MRPIVIGIISTTCPNKLITNSNSTYLTARCMEIIKLFFFFMAEICML